MADKDPFSGDGFDKAPFSESENASLREMLRKVSNAWPSIEGLDNLNKGGTQLIKLATFLAALGGIIAFLVQKGVF